MSRFCYWSVADGDHAKMITTTVASARKVGVQEDFHIWSDIDIPGAITHRTGKFNKDKYIFKLRFLRNEVSKLEGYDYVVWIDADNYFCSHPGDFTDLLRGNKWFVQMESEMTSHLSRRGDWWGCPRQWFPVLIRYHMMNLGLESPKKVYNTNAGFWIVRTDAIVEFYQRAMAFYEHARNGLGLVNFTEEAPLAFVGHDVDDIEMNTLVETCHTWACDWTGHYKDRLPDGKEWRFEDYMSGEHRNVNPTIVHCMRSKDALIKAATPMAFPDLRVVEKHLPDEAGK
jgi:hypothetical protein